VSARAALKSYSKNELERITVLAARKQHAAEEAMKAMRWAVARRMAASFAAGLALGGVLGWWLL
jgi:F0F1-type ATP synthase assembly protein I